MLPPGWFGFWRFCGRLRSTFALLRLELPLLLRLALAPLRGCCCFRSAEGCCLRSGAGCRLVFACGLLADWDLPAEEDCLLALDCWRLGCALRCAAWLLRLTELSPLVLPDWLEDLDCEAGAETEEEGRLPPLLRELPPPDPLRELPLV